MSTRSVLRAASAVASTFSVLALAPVVHAAQRTFVSTGGNDANPCSLAAPCRGFAKAITVTDPGGELVVLDSGGYGFVTVNRSVTILSPAGVYAGISVFAAQDGITVAAPATKVVLRGLTINGQGGNNGIRIQAGEVHIESTVISNLGAAGILVEGGSAVRVSGTVSRSNVDGLRVAPGAGSVSVLVRDSEFSGNSTAGIGVSPSAAGASAQVTVERSSATKNASGMFAAPTGSATATLVITQSVISENSGAGVASVNFGGTVFVRESAITRNAIGLQQASSGVLNACGANLLVANATAQSGAIATTSCLDVASTGGTVTNVATGTGLTGGPITTTGTIAADTTVLQQRVTGSCASGNFVRAIGADGTVTCGTDASGPANAFVQGGNAFGATASLGTTDANAVEVTVNGARVVRYEYAGTSPNIIGGHPNNSVSAAFQGQTIAGGGAANSNCYDPPSDTFTRSCGNDTANGFATVAGGQANRASQLISTVVGGQSNTASGYASMVGGGYANTASGTYSMAFGHHAQADQDRCVLFGLWATNYPFTCQGVSGLFRVGATNGLDVSYYSQAGEGGSRWVYVGPFYPYDTLRAWSGAHLTDAGVWVNASSSKDQKTDFAAIDPGAILRKLASLPVTTWRYKTGEGEVRHMGPMAEDFWAAFGIGYGPQTIADLDARGVALAAIQGLDAKLGAALAEQARENAELRDRVAELESLRGELAALKAIVGVARSATAAGR
jgi:hypothetical protein